jgi:cell division septum initiation protein DivIVA
LKSKKKKYGNLSAQEQKALNFYDPSGGKTDLVINAFLDGYRVKQDYINVDLRAQMEQLKNIIDQLTSASTSVSRASVDIVDAAASSSTMLSSAVTGVIGKSANLPIIQPPVDLPAPKQVKMISKTVQPLSSKPPLEGIKDSNRKESERIIKEETAKRTDLLVDPVTPLPKQSITEEEIMRVLDVDKEVLASFYKVDDLKMSLLREKVVGPYDRFVKVSGGVVAARGALKKMISDISG